ncbi:IS256 family transposase [Marinitoga aeolica]|uniref:Mutator family transposase n=1 Tax=Marinitoga aeolica TaxID=2809031 RepID=A0ABY8PSA4_9BACT|nr:IS256 family transposase [Marinitoga aeolica]WGS64134.1 IS256 family transposase [Marinitoga aeolica]WGS65276.1 IS256 family transposase [Marinitoga aeolica]WGS65500.1 IS256 family transposase [Marinitoga aeolica]
MAKRKKKEESNIEKLAKLIARDPEVNTMKDVYDKIKELMGPIIQEMLEAELEDELGYEKYDKENKETDNSRNGYSSKKVRSSMGEMELKIPRDRKGEYEPKIIPKYKRDISDIEGRIIGMYGLGLSTKDIAKNVEDIYGVELSAEMISKITNKILPEIREWQSRPLEEIYTFVFMDGIVFKVKDDGEIIKKTAYVVIGVNIDGFKEVLGIYIGEIESSKFWLRVLNDLKNRGVKDILIASVDGLTGFPQAIKAAFPDTVVQRCIIHQIRNTLKYVNYKDRKELVNDLKKVYKAPNKDIAYSNLQDLKENKWTKYKLALESWEKHWETISPYFDYGDDVRKIMYTTNVIESLNRQYRKVTKNKTSFPNDDALLKILYLATIDATKRWTARYRNWSKVLNELSIFFKERITKYVYNS